MRRLGSGSEERPRLPAGLSCLKSPEEAGGHLGPEPPQDPGAPSALSPGPRGPSVSAAPPCSAHHRPSVSSSEEAADVFAKDPATPPAAQAPRTPKTPRGRTSQALLNLLPNITLGKSRGQEALLAGRIEDPASLRTCRRNKALAAIHINGNGAEDAALRSPCARTPGPVPASAPYNQPATPVLLDNVFIHRNSPQTMRRDIGLAVTHRFSTKSWLSQTCQVCQRSMMFGVKCKHCKLKCHNKCTKDAPACRISFLTLPRMRRAESVPSDINIRIDPTAEISLLYGTLPKAKREPPPTHNQLDSSSNPSSATSSTPSSPAHHLPSNPPSVSVTPPANPSPRGTASSCSERFHFPELPAATHAAAPQPGGCREAGVSQVSPPETQPADEDPGREEEEEQEEGDVAEQRDADDGGHPPEEGDEDGLEELPSGSCRRDNVGRWRGRMGRMASQNSIYLQEWDIPYEQLQLGELIGKGRWGKVHKGRWHGEVAIRLLEVDGNNQDHLKLFKKEVMNYRQTRHENVVLFMGACMAPPHLAIITSFCKGCTLYSVVRERGHLLDINKIRQIAQEIVNGMGYLHAKGIIHKDLKSKNVFYDANKVVITDFGLFGMSGVVREGRRENVLRIPQGWIYYLAPEIVRRMSPEVEDDQLPFSKAADVYAFGTIWYELQVGDWPITNQPVEAKIWLVGSSQGVKKELADANLGKEVTEILSLCWSSGKDERPTFTQLTDMLEKLPKLNRRLSHPGHFWKTNEYVS